MTNHNQTKTGNLSDVIRRLPKSQKPRLPDEHFNEIKDLVAKKLADLINQNHGNGKVDNLLNQGASYLDIFNNLTKKQRKDFLISFTKYYEPAKEYYETDLWEVKNPGAYRKNKNP